MDKIHIKLQPSQKIFFTSDTHHGHKNVLTFCQRPFTDIKHQGDELVKNWNSVVRKNDVVFHLGDVCWFNSRHDTKKFLDRLNGTIYVVPGNHDTRKQFELCGDHVTILDDTTAVYIEDHPLMNGSKKPIEIFLSHCPMMTWPHRTYGVPNLFGHIHSGPNSKAEVDQDLPLWPYQYDVGVDNNNYTPIELTEVLRIIDWKPKKESN